MHSCPWHAALVCALWGVDRAELFCFFPSQLLWLQGFAVWLMSVSKT